MTTPNGRVNVLTGDVPVIMIPATDALACPLISAYHKLAEGKVTAEHLLAVEAAYTMFADWQEAHPERVKILGAPEET